MVLFSVASYFFVQFQTYQGDASVQQLKLLIPMYFNYINDNIFSVLLGRFYTSQDVGYYTQANKWTNRASTDQ